MAVNGDTVPAPGSPKSFPEGHPSRNFLEDLLAHCVRANLPGNEELIRQIEQALSELPPEDDKEST